MQLMILLLAAIATLTSGTSDSDPGEVYLCDALSPLWGCDPTKWAGGDRLECSETSHIMNWATRPTRSDCYHLFAGPEESPVSQYTPGEYLDVQVRVKCYKMNFRGILLYAVNSQEERVGEWYLPVDDPALYDKPWASIPGHFCKNSIMHASAMEKPYLNLFHFKAPEAGTGSVTFRCLIKYGDANTGDFFWPNAEGDLVLTEGTASPEKEINWLLADAGESCSDFCHEQEQGCVEESLLALNSPEAMDDVIGGDFVCKGPYLSGCGDVGAVYDPSEEFCYYVDSSCSAQNRTPSTVNCDTVSTEFQRLCPCSAAYYSAAVPNMRGAGIWSLVLLFPFILANGRVGIFLTLLIASVVGHNWINSNSRSNGASAYQPCKPSISNLPHAQVGPDQPFQIEWMTGHGSATYFAIVHSDNADKLALNTYEVLDDYIANAPSGSNKAREGIFRKFHRKETQTLDNDWEDNYIVDFFDSYVEEADPDYIYRPASFGGRIGTIAFPDDEDEVYQVRYKDDYVQDDYHVSYQSEKYPWLEAVLKFQIVTKHPRRPDTTNFVIPGFGGEGRYIVQYLWRGYRDCIDVDYKSEPVESVYGYELNETRWTRIDHCLFENPRNIFSKSEVVTDPQFCLDRCTSVHCYGVNVVPLQAPATAYQGFQNPDAMFPSVYGSDFYVPWADDKFASSRDAFIAKASPDRYMCYGVMPAVFTETTDDFTVSNDPEDPIFYSTCYYRLNQNMFDDYLEGFTPPNVNVPWRFNEKCIDCQTQALNSLPETSPKWPLTDTCVNCDAEPAEPKIPKFRESPLVEENMRCDGFGSFFARESHHTCETEDECVKPIQVPGRAIQDSLTLDECNQMVKEDPECGNIFIHRQIDPTRCYCYTNKPCCKTCSRKPATNFNVYEVEATPDPTCSTGVLSADGSACCSGECGEGNCVDNTGIVTPSGFCCSTCITRSCSEYGPPCMM